MNPKINSLICICGALLLIGCESYRETVRGIGSSLGAIQTRDIQSAAAYRKALPSHLNLPPKQVRVEPGSGVTHVTLIGVKAEADRQQIASKLTTLNEKNPQLSPLKWRFE